MKIRAAIQHDVPALRALYRDAVLSQAPAAYTAEQTEAWARTADSSHLGNLILANETFVAKVEDRIAGFCTVRSDGWIALLYVRGEFSRRGIGSALLRWALAHADLSQASALYAEASELSLRLFKKLGFELAETERSTWNGVEFLRYKVRKAL